MNNVKQLGLGMMRLPTANGEIDFAHTCRMVDRFIEAGGVWFDTAWGYHNEKSEPTARRSVTERYPRDSFLLATKLPVWLIKGEDDPERLTQEQLRRTGAEYFDRYMLHALNGGRLENLEKFKVWDYLKGLKDRGIAKKIGFSFHDSADVLEKILSAHPGLDFVQLQINYLDWEDDKVQSRKCYETARAHGVDIIVMEPVKGGMLGALPENVSKPLRAAHPDWSDARWALAFCMSLPGVATILSGMSNAEQLEDNLNTFKNFEPLTDADRAALNEALTILKAMPSIPCTGCAYCVDSCPQKINIPEIFRTATGVMRFGPQPGLMGHYAWVVSEGSGRANECIACHACEGNCPQSLEIANLMAGCATLLDV